MFFFIIAGDLKVNDKGNDVIMSSHKKGKHFEYDDDTGLWWRYGWVQHDDQLFKENYEMNDDDDDDDAGLGWWCNGGKVIWEEIWG